MSREKGQTLVEFALILPILLLVIFVIVESGRIFQAYITVQHAAREGARYAVTGRWEEEFAGEPDPRVASIEDVARNALAGLALAGKAGYDEEGKILTGHYEIKVFCFPESVPIEKCAGNPKEYVGVQVAYRLEIITPVLNVIAPAVQVKGYVEMINEDFGQLGGGGFAGLREPPSPVPPEAPTPGASPTPTETPTGTITPTPLPPTETPTTPACAVQIVGSVYEGDTSVTVLGDPGDTIVLRDTDAGGVIIGTGTVGPGDYCNVSVAIDVNGYLVDGHIIAALSTLYPSSDTACVGVTTCWPTSTPTATATPATPTPTGPPTPTGTPTPTGPYIVLDRTCSPEGQASDITVYGYNWLANPQKTIIIQWDGAVKKDEFPSRVNWSTVINISASEATTGTHTVTALILAPRTEDSKSIVIPCPPTPTPTPTATPLRPDLVITDFTVRPGAVITAYVPVTFTTVIANQGLAGAATLFWVDLFVDPAPAPPTTDSTGDVAWEAASFLGVGEMTTVTLNYAFPVIGPHVAYGYVDTRMDIDEIDEDNNVSSPQVLTVTAGIPPLATLSVEPPCSEVGVPMTITVSGENWPTDEGAIDIQWNGISRGSVSPQVNWSQAITISASEATTGTHMISALTSGTLITSTYYIPCSAMGRIDGYTWIFIGGDIVPHGRVDVYCYDGFNNLIAQTTSDDESYYDLGYIPAGTYTVLGQSYIDEILYLDILTGVAVSEGGMVKVNLLLLPQY